MSWLSLRFGLAISIFSLVLYTIQLRKKEIVALVMVRVSCQYFQFGIVYRSERKKDFVALSRVRVSCQYFCSFGLYTIQLRKKNALALASVRVSGQYFPLLDCVSYSCARKRLWLSLWLGLAVSIFQFWIVYCTVRKKDFMAFARVRVSSQYFQFGIVYHMSCLSLGLGLAVSIFSLGLCIIQLRKKEIVALVMVRVSSQYFQFGIVYHIVAQ